MYHHVLWTFWILASTWLLSVTYFNHIFLLRFNQKDQDLFLCQCQCSVLKSAAWYLILIIHIIYIDVKTQAADFIFFFFWDRKFPKFVWILSGSYVRKLLLFGEWSLCLSTNYGFFANKRLHIHINVAIWYPTVTVHHRVFLAQIRVCYLVFRICVQCRL